MLHLRKYKDLQPPPMNLQPGGLVSQIKMKCTRHHSV